MGLKVCKFGGTSLSDAAMFMRAAEIVKSDPSRRYIVLSAPGKRSPRDKKVTDLLYALSDHARKGEFTAFERVYDHIAERFSRLAETLSDGVNGRAIRETAETLKNIRDNILHGGEFAAADYAASRGEYLTAKLMSALLGFPFIDSVALIRFHADGTFDEEGTGAAFENFTAKYPRAVIPGFYGADGEGNIHTFPRGGSDITGAVVAVGVSASAYENWTDVNGFYACDPRLIRGAERIPWLTYSEVCRLSRGGAEVIHADSIAPVKRAGIPVFIRNTFAPKNAGTAILPDRSKNGGIALSSRPNTAFAVRRGLTLLKFDLKAADGLAIASSIKKQGAEIVHKTQKGDTMYLIIALNRQKIPADKTKFLRLFAFLRHEGVSVIKNTAVIAAVALDGRSEEGFFADIKNKMKGAGLRSSLLFTEETDTADTTSAIYICIREADIGGCMRALYFSRDLPI